MKVREAMAKTISYAGPEDSVEKVAKMMRDEDAGFIPVVEDGRPVGVVTDRDIVVRFVADGHTDTHQPVEHCMTREVEAVSPDDDLSHAGKQMESHGIRRLIVMENGRCVGVLSHGNLVQAMKGTDDAHHVTEAVTEGA